MRFISVLISLLCFYQQQQRDNDWNGYSYPLCLSTLAPSPMPPFPSTFSLTSSPISSTTTLHMVYATYFSYLASPFTCVSHTDYHYPSNNVSQQVPVCTYRRRRRRCGGLPNATGTTVYLPSTKRGDSGLGLPLPLVQEEENSCSKLVPGLVVEIIKSVRSFYWSVSPRSDFGAFSSQRGNS